MSIDQLQPLPNLSLYFKLGSSEEDMVKFRQSLLNAGKPEKNNKYLDFLQIYE